MASNGGPNYPRLPTHSAKQFQLKVQDARRTEQGEEKKMKAYGTTYKAPFERKWIAWKSVLRKIKLGEQHFVAVYNNWRCTQLGKQK
ncbi:unnamed protein product [Caenorhabditis brenneri]